MKDESPTEKIIKDGIPIMCYNCGVMTETKDGKCKNCGADHSKFNTPKDSNKNLIEANKHFEDGE